MDNNNNAIPQPIPRPKKKQRNQQHWKRNRAKVGSLSGKQYFGNRDQLKEGKVFDGNRDCNCHPKCREVFTEAQKERHFREYYSSNSHSEKFLYLRSFILREGTRNRFHLKINGELKPVCLTYFLGIFAIKYSALRTKVLKWESAPKDSRGSYQNRLRISPAALKLTSQFIHELDPRESHYSRTNNPSKKYLDSNQSVSNLYREFITKNPSMSPYAVPTELEIENGFIPHVKFWMFSKIFNEQFNIGFGYPRSDICEICELNHTQQAKDRNDLEALAQLNQAHEYHLQEAQGFYDSMESKLIAQLPVSTACLCFDFQKNFPLPVTNTSSEFYSRQLWIHNFGVHDLKTGKAVMYMYSETYARKGCNEVISCLKHYLDNFLPDDTQDLKLWSDNYFGQNKNRYLMAYLNAQNDNFHSIELNFPIPGHSRMSIDRDFATMEKVTKKSDEFNFPSDWVKLVKQCRQKDPFTVVYVEHPLTDDLCDDGTLICPVFDFKTTLNPILRPPTGINRIRGIRFLANGEIWTRQHTTGEFAFPFHILRTFATIDQLKQVFQGVPKAYHDFVLVTPEKLKNVNKLLRFVHLPESCIFYESMRQDLLEEIPQQLFEEVQAEINEEIQLVDQINMELEQENILPLNIIL